MSDKSALVAPERNNFFYGKLMDEAQFEKEQRYFNRKRWLLNRLALGSGVLCGLSITQDPDAPGKLRIEPGVAIDGLGREIVVPVEGSVNPHQLTDEEGSPVGDPVADGIVEIRLTYTEIKTDPVPVLVPTCDTPGNCAPGTIRESFCILVRPEGSTPGPAIDWSGRAPLPAGEIVRDFLGRHVTEAWPQSSTDSSVLLARVDLKDGSIQQGLGRDLVCGSLPLNELILWLVKWIDQLFRWPLLRYVSGDGQVGEPNKPLDRKLKVCLVDEEGNPVRGKPVAFEVTAGDGKVSRRNLLTSTVIWAQASAFSSAGDRCQAADSQIVDYGRARHITTSLWSTPQAKSGRMTSAVVRSQ